MPAKREDKDLWDNPEIPSEKATGINRDRMKTYGTPVPNMEMFAKLITPIVYPNVDGLEVTPMQAAMILVQLKVMREVQAGYPLDYPDNLEDMCGWVNVLFQCKEASGASE
jgi:Domain of unknown function (DUF6378)